MISIFTCGLTLGLFVGVLLMHIFKHNEIVCKAKTGMLMAVRGRIYQVQDAGPAHGWPDEEVWSNE